MSVDAALKISELEIPSFFRRMIVYPKFEWHKSNDDNALKNKIEAGVNFEIFVLKLRDNNPGNIATQRKGAFITPLIYINTSIKHNYVDTVFERKVSGIISLQSLYKYMPGYSFHRHYYVRDSTHTTDTLKTPFVGIYYPYFGIEYNYMPDLVNEGETEEFCILFAKLFFEYWPSPRHLQFTIEASYKENITQSSNLQKVLSIVTAGLDYYPGNQENFSIGLEYKNGHDPDTKYKKVEYSSLKLGIKF